MKIPPDDKVKEHIKIYIGLLLKDANNNDFKSLKEKVEILSKALNNIRIEDI